MFTSYTRIITIKFCELRNTPTSRIRNEIKLSRIRLLIQMRSTHIHPKFTLDYISQIFFELKEIGLMVLAGIKLRKLTMCIRISMCHHLCRSWEQSLVRSRSSWPTCYSSSVRWCVYRQLIGSDRGSRTWNSLNRRRWRHCPRVIGLTGCVTGLTGRWDRSGGGVCPGNEFGGIP